MRHFPMTPVGLMTNVCEGAVDTIVFDIANFNIGIALHS